MLGKRKIPCRRTDQAQNCGPASSYLVIQKNLVKAAEVIASLIPSFTHYKQRAANLRQCLTAKNSHNFEKDKSTNPNKALTQTAHES